MKKGKMTMLVKRLPNEGLFDLQQIIEKEIGIRGMCSKYIKSTVNLKKQFFESTLPFRLPQSGALNSGKNKHLKKELQKCNPKNLKQKENLKINTREKYLFAQDAET